MMQIAFGEFKPDSSMIGADTLSLAHGVYADGSTYSPMKELVPFSAPLKGTPLGSASFIDRNGNVISVAGDENSLYVNRGGFNWEDISKPGGYDATGNVWRFVLWGDYILATDYKDNIQKWHINSSEMFEDMSPTAPRCKDMAVVNEFLVLINVVDKGEEEDAVAPDAIWNSPIGDPFGTWEVNQTTMCDRQVLPIGSYCVGIVGGSYGIIMMRGAIYRMTFVGSPVAFKMEIIELERGCVGIEAFCTDGRDIYYLAQDGFFMLNGSQSMSLGTDKVDKYFFDNSELTSANIVTCTFDKVKKIVLFGYPGKGEYVKPTKMLIYGVLAQRWTEGDCVINHFTQVLSTGYTLETLDTITTDVDDLPFSMDSNYYKGGIPSIGGFSSDKVMLVEGEDNLESFIATGDIALVSNEQRALTQRVRPILEGGIGHFMTIATKQALEDEVVYGRNSAQTRVKDFSYRASGRYHRFKFAFRGRWNRAKGFEVSLTTEGEL